MPDLEKVAEKCRVLGSEVIIVQCDVAKETDCKYVMGGWGRRWYVKGVNVDDVVGKCRRRRFVSDVAKETDCKYDEKIIV